MDLLTIYTIILFAAAYVLMFAFQKIRPLVAICAALIFVATGSLGLFPDFHYGLLEGLMEIDWNVILMIAGTMGTVYLFTESKMPQLISDLIIAGAPSVKWMILSLSLFAGLISAFVDNVATVLMVAPVAMAVCKKLDISPVPAIICISISSNLQGAATLVGDTTSFLLAKAAGLDFMGFFFVKGKAGIFWATEAGALASAFIIYYIFRRENTPINIKGRTKVTDFFPTVLLVLTILCLILISGIPYKEQALPGQIWKPEITNGLICTGFFLVGLLRQSVKDGNLGTAKAALKSIDYYTIVLLIGLFIIIGAVQEAGIIDLIGVFIAGLGRGGGNSRFSVFVIYSIIVWMSVLFSAFIDNIPYTATMLPVIPTIVGQAAAGGMYIHPELLYFGLLIGATLGGNITPIGASANITGIGMLRKEGYEVSTREFMGYSLPITLSAVFAGYLLTWIIWM